MENIIEEIIGNHSKKLANEIDLLIEKKLLEFGIQKDQYHRLVVMSIDGSEWKNLLFDYGEDTQKRILSWCFDYNFKPDLAENNTFKSEIKFY